MSLTKINGKDYLNLVRTGAERLSVNKKTINDLNVFPIPDGDTGDNMYMTISSGATGAKDAEDISTVAASVSSGMLLGARGNSGVILSRIFAGIAKGLEGIEEADTKDFSKAMEKGVEESYNAVSTPVEGTILTVFKDGTKAANESGAETFEDYFDALEREMEASLDRTPDLLDVLKEAGVVDSGGAGLLCIIRGMRDAVFGNISFAEEEANTPVQPHQADLNKFGPDTPLTYGYCTEFLLRLQNSKVDTTNFDETEIRDYLCSVGESVVCFKDGTIVKVHVHTKTPGDILSHCQRWGEFLTLKIENMTLQHSEVEIQNNFDSFRHEKPYGTVAVASGEGLVNTFKEAGVDVVIEGGQTMNPSAQDFIDAFDKVGAKTIFVFPNNSNIVMTAQQAAQMYDRSEVIVLPSKNIGAGYVAAASLDTSSKDTESIVAAAREAIDSVTTGMVSTAIRNAVQNGIEIVAGKFVGFEHDTMLACEDSAEKAAEKVAEELGAGDHDVALVFSGKDNEPEKARALQDILSKKYPRTEIIMTDGGQPVYNYIIVLC